MQNIQNAKLKLINQIDELELERDSLRSLLANASLPAVQAIFDALVAGSPVDESLLPPLLSAAMLRLKTHCDALGQPRPSDGAASWQRDEDVRHSDDDKIHLQYTKLLIFLYVTIALKLLQKQLLQKIELKPL